MCVGKSLLELARLKSFFQAIHQAKSLSLRIFYNVHMKQQDWKGRVDSELIDIDPAPGHQVFLEGGRRIHENK